MTGKITSLIQSSAEYSILILRELISLITYINALIVGAAINFFSGMGFPGKLTPYIVPVIVQAFSKAAVKYRNRNKDFLLQLPAKREDPVFVMDKDGFVHFSIGLTEELFKRENIKNIKDFIDDKCFDSLIKLINDHGDNFGYLDVYSNLMDKWYEVKIRTTDTISDAEECIVWFTDITIRKSIESELKTEASFVNNNPAPVFRTDPDGKIISSNQAAVDIIGSESINEKIDAVIYSLSMDDFADIKAGKKTQYQEKIGEKTILFSFKPDEESDTVYVYGSDITSFVKLEEEMAEKAAFMRNNPAPVLHINYKGKIISYNPASMHVFGNNLSESAVSSIFPDIELEDLISLKEEEQIQLEMKDNERVYLFTFKNDSKTESIFIYGSDITSLKDAENRFKNITAGIEQAFDSIVITDIKGKITYVNPAFESITGYSKEEVVNKNPRLLKSGKQSYEFYMEMWQRITSGKIWQGDMINRKKSGDLYYEEMSIAPVKNENDEIINFIAIKRDVSDKKELENKLGRLRREHTAFMRHELNNMITPVKGFADILSSTEENLDDKQKSYVDKIRISSERIIHLIDSLKQLEDFEIEKFEIDRTDGELKNILDQSFNDVMILADENKVKINFEDKSENSIIPMDKDLMPGVFTNLIKNAVEHIAEIKDAAQKIVKINMINENGHVIVRINNKGEPVPEEKQNVFFEKFNSDRSKKKDGTGLGTTYAYLVTKAHDGEISIDSNAQNGTTITLKFKTI